MNGGYANDIRATALGIAEGRAGGPAEDERRTARGRAGGDGADNEGNDTVNRHGTRHGKAGRTTGGATAGRAGANAKKKNRTSRAWVARHLDDPYVKLAQKHGYRSRAAFKLLEIDRRDRLVRRGMVVVDLGSAPGAWSQVLRERLARPGCAEAGLDGRILAVDLLPMEPVPGVEFLQGDLREAETLERLEAALGDTAVDLVISDMAPNLSGVAAADAARMADLAELAIDFAVRHLKGEGALLVKCFHGSGYSQIVEAFRRNFFEVLVRKPEASRSASAETYLLGRRPRRPLVGGSGA